MRSCPPAPDFRRALDIRPRAWQFIVEVQAMTSQKPAGFLKSHWPLAIIAIAVAVLAFAAGMFTSNKDAPDEPTPAVGTNSAVAPTPTVPPELYYTPTNEQWEIWRQERDEREKKRIASGADGENRSGRSRVIILTPTPRSTAEALFREVPMGRALYFVASDKVIFLPEGVEKTGSIVSSSCYHHENCPAPPVTLLKNGDATVSLDTYGDVVPGLFDTDDPDAFPFLKEHDE